MTLRHWLRTHREGLISIAIIALIFAGLIIIWGDGEDDRTEVNVGPFVPDPSHLAAPVSHDDLAARQTLWEQASYNATTTIPRASRSAKTRTVLPKATSTVSGDVWAALRRCENGGSYTSQPGDRYRGAYQFDPDTWEGLGYSGDPADADAATQDEAARRLQARSGWGQWPRCSRKLGLR